jgi:hypothetical protein
MNRLSRVLHLRLHLECLYIRFALTAVLTFTFHKEGSYQTRLRHHCVKDITLRKGITWKPFSPFNNFESNSLIFDNSS